MIKKSESVPKAIINKFKKLDVNENNITNPLPKETTATDQDQKTVPTCDICKKTFKTTTGMKIHIGKAHSAETQKTTGFNCNFCQKQLQSAPGKLKHEKTCSQQPNSGEPNVDQMFCKVCKKNYSNKQNLNRHLKASTRCRLMTVPTND